MEQKQVKVHELLEKGLKAFRKVLEQEVKVTREDMLDLINFEQVVQWSIDGAKALDGKSSEEILKLRDNLENNLKTE